ncbi:leucine-rich repeat-containing protein 51 isoform X2 [Petaurus breviceps papuanus]|uniref:leucine-rich repeat-containing protein 51 isoform X2 n=1 Tax=Petaurus breviceps papuanus TaxID=3040969 RepID=UPI0036DF019F
MGRGVLSRHAPGQGVQRLGSYDDGYHGVAPSTGSVPPSTGRQRLKKTELVSLGSIWGANWARIEADLISEEPRTGLRPVKHSKQGKSLTQAVRLNNNVLNDLADFSQTMSQLLEHPQNLAWIDLSFNDLPNIDPVLTTFFNLSVLYLHGNCIHRLPEVDKLSNLTKLRSLTLHGNPIEEEKGYSPKSYILPAGNMCCPSYPELLPLTSVVSPSKTGSQPLSGDE